MSHVIVLKQRFITHSHFMFDVAWCGNWGWGGGGLYSTWFVTQGLNWYQWHLHTKLPEFFTSGEVMAAELSLLTSHWP